MLADLRLHLSRLLISSWSMLWLNRDGTGRSRAAGGAGRTPRQAGAVGQPTARLLTNIMTCGWCLDLRDRFGCSLPRRPIFSAKWLLLQAAATDRYECKTAGSW